MNKMLFDMEKEDDRNSHKSREDMFNELTASEEEFLHGRKKRSRMDEENFV